MSTGKALNEKPYAGNPHMRFDVGEVASAATPRRGSLLCRKLMLLGYMALVGLPLAAAVNREMVNGVQWTYSTTNGTASVGGGTPSLTAVTNSTSGALVIPTSLGNCPVRSVGSYAFYHCTRLTDVTIPNGVTTVGGRAFAGCTRLASITFEGNAPYVSGGTNAFLAVSSNCVVHVSRSSTGWGVDIPGTWNGMHIEYAEEEGPQPTFTISNGVLTRVELNGATEVTIPNGVTSISNSVFRDMSSLIAVTIPNGVTNIGISAFYRCGNLTSVRIPAGVRSIAANTFNACSNLTSVTIPATVTSIGGWAFSACSKLADLTLPNGLVRIENGAFWGCAKLTDLTIPPRVVAIMQRAFESCTSLSNVVFEGNAPGTVSSNAFSNVHSDCVVHVSRSSTGWGVDIPGTWNGMRIEYSDPPPSTPWAGYLGEPVNGTYEIDDQTELVLFQQGVADGLETSNITFKLTADIVLDAPWPGIGIQNGKDLASSANANDVALFDGGAFHGTFDGQNHTISGFQMQGGGLDYCGFFNSIYGATIKNLKIQYAGSLFAADTTSSSVESGATFVGVAKDSMLQNLTSLAGSVSCSKGIGGIVGFLSFGSVVESCTNNVNLTSLANNKAGGIVMITQSGTAVTVRNCQNNGTTTGNATQKGGIVGLVILDGTIIDGCTDTAGSAPSFLTNWRTVTMQGVNKAPAGSISYQFTSTNTVDGLNFATISDGVATFAADNALALNGSYKVMATNAVATFTFAAPGTIAFDTSLFTPTFDIAADSGLSLTSAAQGNLVTYTAAWEGGAHTVTFDLGEHGTRTGGGALIQTVTNGCAAVAPVVAATSGWTFTGWDVPFTNVTSNLTVTAQYAVEHSAALPGSDAYVQEGLIAQWDAIDNVGTGVHDPAATAWKDLKGNYDLTLMNNAAWKNGDRLVVNGASAVGATSMPGYMTIEVVYRMTNHTGRILFTSGNDETKQMVLFDNAKYTNRIVRGYFSGINGANLGVEWPFDASALRCMAATYANAGVTANAVYADGVPRSDGAVTNSWLAGNRMMIGNRTGTSSSYPWYGEVSAIRLYNRELTPEMIAANHLIDMKRFGGQASSGEGGSWSVIFDLGTHGTRIGGGALSQTVTDGCAAVAPEIAARDGWRFAGWDADFGTVTNNVIASAIFERHVQADWYVDAAGGSDANGGHEEGDALKTIQKAIDLAGENEVVCVMPGVYAPISTSDKRIRIIGVQGAGHTVIDASLEWAGGMTNRCATLGTTTNTVLSGMALVNGNAGNGYGGGAYYGTLEDCVVSNCTAYCGGGTAYTRLKRCVVQANSAISYGGGTYYGLSESTLVVENMTAGRGGGTYYGTHVNATISANTAGLVPGGCMYGTLRNSISYGNTASSGSASYYNVTNATCVYSCVYPSQSGTQNIASDPKFMNAAAGDYSLQISSPCVNRGWNFLAVDELDLAGNARYRGARTDMGAYECQSGTRHNGTTVLHVAADSGSDLNDGLSWDTPFKTLQAAIDASCPGMRISVTNGTYAPITGTLNKAIRIESVNGAGVTVIDGNSTMRCALLGTGTSDRATVLSGFTLTNGYVNGENGGGVKYGTLEDCVITGCRSVGTIAVFGGGSSDTDASRCMYLGNSTRNNGGAAYRGLLKDCTFANNSSEIWGGGTGWATASNCVYYGNSANAYDGGAVCSGTLYNCVVTNNTAARTAGGTTGATLYNCLVAQNRASSACGGVMGGSAYNCTICNNTAPYFGGVQNNTNYNCIIWGNVESQQTSNYANVSNSICYATCTTPLQANDPQNISSDPLFVDAMAGNYHLATNSPCVDTGVNRPAIGAVDLDGNVRVSNRRVDMGAYELQQHAAGDGRQNIWYVDAASGDDAADGLATNTAFKTINCAVSGAKVGDVICVMPGVYSPVTSINVGIRIESVGGPESTIIDASLTWPEGITNRCATLSESGSFTTTNVVLKGFTLVNGRAMKYSATPMLSYFGGGSFGGTLIDCVVTNCEASQGGGCYYSRVSNSRIVDNRASTGGGAVNCTIDRSVIVRNRASTNGGGVVAGYFSDCIIAENVAERTGGGVYWGATMLNCTITANRAAKGGGLYFTSSVPGASNSIIWGNTLHDGVTVDNWAGLAGYGNFEYCCTTPLSARGSSTSIDTEPGLCRFPGDIYRIPAGSPCVNAGSNNYAGKYYYQSGLDLAGNMRVQDGRVDIGAIEGGFEGVAVGTRCEGYGNISESVACQPGETVVVEVSQRDDIHELSGIFLGGTNAGTTEHYEVLEYVDVAAGTWVNTGYTPECTDRTQTKVRIADTNSNQCIYCARTANYSRTFTLLAIGGKFRFDRVSGNVFASSAISVGNDYELVADGNSLVATVNGGSALTMTSGTFAPGSPFVLFASHMSAPGDGVNNYFWGRFYYFRVYNSAGNIVREFLPARRSSDGAVGILETVQNRFLMNNSNSGGLTAGGSVISTRDLNSDGLHMVPLDGITSGGGVTNVPGTVLFTNGIYRLALSPTGNVSVVARFASATLYVATNGNDSATGGSWGAAKRTIQAAIGASAACDTIIVTNGTYGAITQIQNYPLMIQSVNGRDSTFIDGQGRTRCANLGLDTFSTNVTLVGFTLSHGNANSGDGGGACYGTLRDCRITSCAARNGGGTYYSNLERCIVSSNSAANCGGGTYYGTLLNCLVAENTAVNNGGGTYYGTLYNCTVAGNQVTTSSAAGCGSYDGTAYNSIIYCNTGGSGDNAYNTALNSSCTDYDPQFTTVDGQPWNITLSSPCLDAGNNGYVSGGTDLVGNVRIQNGTVDMGCYERIPESGVPLTSVTVESGTYTYRGTAWTPEVTVRSGDGILRQGEHFTLSWFDNIDAGTATVVATGTGSTFAGTVTNTFTIVPKTLTTSMFSVGAAYPFTGAEVCPSVAVTESTLTTNDWSVAYTNNIAPGMATVTLTGKRNYTGTVSYTFAISSPTLYVATSGDDAAFGVSADAPKRTLQAAVTAAYDGAVIHVGDGVYGPVNTANKSIQIVSDNGPEKTIIDGGGTNRCVFVGGGGLSTNTVIEGFTICNGWRPSGSWGIGTQGGTLRRCIIRDCTFDGANSVCGGGAAQAVLENCLIVGNAAYYGGGARDCTLVNCSVFGNTATSGGGVYACTVINSIVWGNYSSNSYSNRYSGTFTYSCTAPAMSGTGNINVDPYFADPVNGDYRLRQYSPCLDVGNNSYVVGESDLSGTNRVIDGTVDMGAFEGWVYLPLPGEIAGFAAEDGVRIGAVRLTWTADEYAKTYTVCRSTTNTFETFETIGSTGSHFYDDDSAQPETTYWYRVFGVNPAGAGPESAVDSGWCLGEMTFGTNVLATATAGLYYSTQLEITGGSGRYTWKSGADDYDVAQGESTYLVSDLVSTGVSGDDNCLSYPLPFDFPFFGKSYNKVWINSNGTLTFDGEYNGYAAALSPFTNRVMIAVMWKDLRTGSGGVGVSTNGGDSVTFFWNNASYYSGGAAVNASVTLYSDGTVLCSYGNGNASGAFVGVSAGDGVHYRHFNLVGTSLANYDDIRFVPQDVPGGLSLASDGTLSGVAAAPGTYTFTVFVTDSYGNGATRKITLEVESNPNLRTVQFDLGAYGVRGGGGDLLQYVMLGESATAPSVRSRAGWVFDSWNRPFTNISENVTVSANYRSAYADLHVDVIDVTNVVASGESLDLRWVVGNTGNPSFNGKMTERISLVSSADSNDVRVIASPTFEGLIERDGVIERNVTIDVPLKGWEGSWHVRIQTAINSSVQEYAANNVTTTDAVLEITAVPLPNLKVTAPICAANLVPGEMATFSVTTTNSGAAAASAPWMERVYLESVDSGTSVKIGDVSRTNDLCSASALTGEYTFAVPEMIAIAGAVRVKVVADANGDVVESNDDDNASVSTEVLSLSTNLYLAAASDSIRENVSSGVRFTVKRSGPTAEALTVTLGNTDASSASVPVTVTIPAGSASTTFYVKPIDNATVDGSRAITVSASAGDCRSASLALTILDNEVPKLTVALDSTTIREGDGVILATVTRELVTDEPLTVYLAGASASRCSYPSSVVIPAGEASVTFEISVPNNATAQTAQDMTLRASSSGYTSGSVTYTVEDDDVPGVTLSLTPEAVSEGAGAQAIYATLTRSDTNQIKQAVRVRLTASEPNQLILPSEVTIPKYTMAVRFAVGIVDNALDDGDRDVTIDGAIVIESCGCSGQPSNGDVIQAVVGIIDNDGPALALRADPTTMKEGYDPAGYLVLSHNSVLTEDLHVRLWVDAENMDEIVIPETMTIPAGQTSVRVPVKTLDDGVEDGGQLVSVYAEVDGDAFAPASTWVQVSDQNLPDLTVSDVELSSGSVVGKSQVEVSFVIANNGFVKRASSSPWGIYVVTGTSTSLGDAQLVASGMTQGGLDVSGCEAVTLSVTVPERPGNYRFAVSADPDSLVAELDEANNTTWSGVFTVTPCYTATVAPEKEIYLPGERVFLRGVATLADGTTPAANRDVEVYVLNNPYRRTYTVRTGNDGSFEAEFLPVSGEGGHYTVGASYPKMSATAGQASFDILGIRRTSTSYVEFKMYVGDEKSVNVPIRNLSSIPLTGVEVICPDSPEECELTASVPDSIPGDGTVNVRVDVRALAATPENIATYRKLFLRVVTAEGVSVEFPVYFYSSVYVPPTPQKSISLSFSPSSINANMAVGETQYKEAVLTNTGRDPSGEITLRVPTASWLRAANGNTLPPLAAGESTTVTLELTPGETLALNSPISGVVQAYENELGKTANLNFSFTPVSSNTGRIRISPIDEYTYYQDGSPHVTGVTVQVSNPYTKARVASGVTDGTGVWLSPDLPCGVYDVAASEGNHASWSARLEVEACATNSVEPFMTFSAVKYSWDVKRVEIDDTYEITLLADFVTSVPKPTVLLEVPGTIPLLNAGESYSFNVTAVNHGLISARNVRFSFPENFPYQYEFAVPVVDEIPAKSTVVVPVRIFVPERTRARLLVTEAGNGELTYNPCSYGIMAMFEYLCGPEIREAVARSSAIQVAGLACDALVTMMQVLAQSFPSSLPGGGGDPSLGGGGGGGGGGGDWLDRLNEIPPFSQDFVMTNCIMGLKILECLLDRQLLGKFKFKETLGAAIAYNRYGYGEEHDVWDAFMGDLQGAVKDVASGGNGGGATGFSTKDLGMILKKAVEDKLGNRLSIDDLKKVVDILNKALSDELTEEDLVDMLEEILEKYSDGNPLDDFGIDVSDLTDLVFEMRHGDDGDDDDDDGDDDDDDDDEEDSCMSAINYYFDVYKKVRDAELQQRKAEREAEANGAQLLGVAPIDDYGAILDKLCAPEIQDDAAVAAAGVVYVYTSWRKLVYMLGEGEWVNDVHVFTFPQYMRAAYVKALMNGAPSNRLPPFGDDETAILKEYAAEYGTVSEGAIEAFVARWNRTVEYWDEGKFTKDLLDENDNDDFIDADVVNDYIEKLAECQDVVSVAGRESLATGLQDAMRHIRVFQTAAAGEVCARVSLNFKQTVTIAREAFEGTLTIYNGHDSAAMENVKLQLSVTDAEGNVCNDLFGITESSLEEFQGTSIRSGGVTLGAKRSGVATILFVPTAEAAPMAAKVYYFGGKLSYVDPFSGSETTVTLAPVALLVNPCPQLTLHYFLQQEVFGDDPFTPDVVEPSEPAELALLVVNRGAGEATRMTVRAMQPEKVVNEKGLLVDFNLSDYAFSGAKVNGVSGGTLLETDLGTIPANGTAQAQWWLTSSVQGRFTGMSAQFMQLNNWGNPKTCLIDATHLHPLVKSVSAGATALPDFLVSENAGDGGADTLYLDDGSVLDVSAATDAVLAGTAYGARFEATLRFTATGAGAGAWYGSVADPGEGRYVIEKVTGADGTELPLENFWLRDRSIEETGAPVYGSKLHFFAMSSSAGVQEYVVTFVAKPSNVPEVVSFDGVVDGAVEYTARNEVAVVFSKPIDPATFTVEDLQLMKQGAYLSDLSALTIEPADDSGTRFTIGKLSALCGEYGRYELTVQCLGIADTVGQSGTFGKSVVWTYATEESPYIVNVDGVPVRRVRSLDTVTVTLSAPVDPTTFTASALGLNGASLGSDVSVLPLDASGTRFSVSGLATAQLSDREYALTIDASALTSAYGATGTGSRTVTWIRDTVAPVLQSLTREDGLNGNEFTLSFSEEVEFGTLTPNGATIRRNGAAVALPATASVRRVGDNASCQYVLSGIDSALTEDGEYELSFSANGVTDEAGNLASGSRSVAWTVDRTPPAQIVDLAISPDEGFSDTDGITCTDTLTVSGTLPEAGLTVEIIAKYVGVGETVLATMPSAGGESLPAGAFSQDIVMPGTGNATLVVRLTDAAGNSSDSEKSVSVDGVALTGTLSGASDDEGVVTTTANLVFSAKPMGADVTFDKFTLTRDGEAVALEGVTFASVDDTTFSLTGLESLCSDDGVYVLRFDGSTVRKYTSGLMMSGSLVMRWRYENPDREPPTVTAVLFDGETPHEAYTNVFSTVAVTFSEPVNVPDLIVNGLVGRAARVDLLDEANSVTGSAVVASAMTWNGESNTLSWQIDPLSVPAGRTRLMLDAGLIADLAGNRLAAEGYAATNGMRTYTLSETVLANVNAQAMPTWYNGELYVGEKTADNKGKIRHYAANGTWTYLQSEGVDIEIPAQGCQGASVTFADMDGDGVAETYIGTTGGDILKYPGGAPVASLEANRAMPYAYDINGDGRDELIAGGMDGRIRLISHDVGAGTYFVALISDVNGAPISVPNGRASPVVTDINHDGHVDIVSGDTAGNVWAYLGDGDVWRAQPVTVFTNKISLADRSRLGYGDVNADGIGDLIVGRSDGSVTVMLGAETPSPIVSFAVKAVVSASAGVHGAIAPVGDATCDGGDTPEYAISPDLGYHVADVQVDGVSIDVTNRYVFAPLTTSHTIHADFAVIPYAITYTGLKGATNGNPETYTVEDEIAFAAPGDVYGWVFKGWTPESIALGTTGPVEVAASWERQKFDVTVNGEPRQYDYEEEVTFTAPEPSVDELCKTQFVYVGTSYTAPVVTNEFTVTVTNGFEFAWDVLATNYWFDAADTQNGSVVVPKAGWMADGTNFVLEAVSADHYHFVGWTGDTNGCEAADAQLAVVMDQARTIGAEFAIDTFAVTFEAGAHGALSGATAQTIDYGATAVVPGVTPDAGYEFTGWSGDVVAPAVSNAIFTAQYAAIPYAITYTGLKGATNGNPETYTVEDEIAFAAPGDVYGWVFKGWTPESIALGTTGPVEVAASWERQKFDVTVNGETCQYSYEDIATLVTNDFINIGATQYVCKGWTATNANPGSGDGARAEFRVLGDVSLTWLLDTNVVTLAQSVNAEDLDWTTGGAAEWSPEWSDAANDGVHHAYSGTIGNNTNTWIETAIEGAGTLSFVWKSSTEARYDMFQLIVDGEVKGTISGETPWSTNSIVLVGGTHTIRWNYRKSRSGTAGTDRVWLDGVTWTADVPPTLAEALNPDLFWKTDGDVEWTAVRKDSILDPHDDWATVGGLADYESSLIETVVYGAGALTFDWAASCEDGYDWFDFIADGEIRESITGETGWKTVTVEFADDGKHVLRWEYWKDEMDEEELVGTNRARLDNVRWTPVSSESQCTVTTPVPVPFADIRTAYSNYWIEAEGDYEVAAHMNGRNGYAIWESYVAGLVPDVENSKFTAKIEMIDGKPVITWEPDNAELRATRTYTTYGKKTLLDKEWMPVTDPGKGEYNFFKVEVKLK